NGTLLSVANHAMAETPKTTNPMITQGDVAALMISEPPSALARSVAVFMPCLSMICPDAASPTAHSSRMRLAKVNFCLRGVEPRSLLRGERARPASVNVSGALDNQGLLRVRRQTQDELVAEERRADPDQPAVEPAHHPQATAVGARDDAQRHAGHLLL